MSEPSPSEKQKTSDLRSAFQKSAETVTAEGLKADRGNRIQDFVVDVVEDDDRVRINVIILPGTPRSRAFGPIERAAARAIQSVCNTSEPPDGFELIRVDQSEMPGGPVNLCVEELGIDDACNALTIDMPRYYAQSRGWDVDELKNLYTTAINEAYHGLDSHR